MSRQELQELLLNAYKSRIGQFGFRPARSQYFVRSIADGTVGFHVRFKPSSYGLEVAADACIRFNEVETMRNRFEGLKVIRSEDTWTLANEFGSLLGEHLKYWPVRDAVEVDPVVDEVIATFQRVGLPYLTKYASRLEALYALSGDGRQSRRLFQIMEQKRLMNILILAINLNDVVRFNEFAGRFRDYAEAVVEPGRSRYLTFVQELEVKLRERP